MCSPIRTLDRAGGERAGHLVSRSKCSRRGREGDEESVALRIDFDASVASARLADDPSVLGERLCVGCRSELVQEPRRAFDVGEKEGDCAAREIVSHAP